MVMKMRVGKRDGLLKLIEELPDDIIMAEVGCFAGESAQLFLQSDKINTFYAIDPWKNGYNGRDPASSSDLVEAENKFDERTNGYNVIKLKMTLEESFDELPELDFIYIDGDHQYDAVLRDTKLGIKKVKLGGIVSGHDYRKENPIVRVVKKLFGEADMIFPDTSWLIINTKKIKNEE